VIKLSRDSGPAGSQPAFAERDMSTASRAAPQRLSGAITVPAFAFSRIRYPQYHSAAPCGSAYPAAGCPEVEEVYGAYRVLETEDRIGL